MFKKIAISLLLFCVVNSYSQQELITIQNYFNDISSPLKEAFPIVNERTNDVSLFLLSAKYVYGFLLDEDFKIKKELKSENRDRQYKIILGYSISDNNEYRVFLTNKRKDEFATINISYNDNKTDLKEFYLQYTNEFFVQSINQDNKFYLLSVLKNTSILKLYSFNKDGTYSVKGFDFSDKIFLNERGKKANLYSMIPRGISPKKPSLKKIEEDVPTSIEVASEKIKMFIQDSKVFLTFDENVNFTQVISIDLISHEKQFLAFEKPFSNVNASEKRTNSFINGDHIFMIASTKEDFNFKVLDIKSKELIKEYIVNVNDSISFKNSRIIQEGGVYDRYREFDENKKFLRKITSGNIGASVNNYKNGYKIVLGGTSLVTSGTSMGMGMLGSLPAPSFGNITVYFSPVNYAYSSYVNTRSTFINCLFDKNFNHQKGIFPENAFDKIRNYEKSFNKHEIDNNINSEDFDEGGVYDVSSSKGEIVFKYKDFYIKGFSFFGQEKYILQKFEE